MVLTISRNHDFQFSFFATLKPLYVILINELNMKKTVIVLIISLFCASCKKNNTDLATMDGVWIESSHKKDTLYFDSSNSMFALGRGKEMYAGRMLPKINSGPYIYEIKNDSISLQYSLSSFYQPKLYYFNVDPNKGNLTIGNFYIDSLHSIKRLNFIKAR